VNKDWPEVLTDARSAWNRQLSIRISYKPADFNHIFSPHILTILTAGAQVSALIMRVSGGHVPAQTEREKIKIHSELLK